MARIGAVVLATMAALALASYIRGLHLNMGIPPEEVEPPPPSDPFRLFGLHPFEIGLAVQIVVVPVALTYLFSNTHLFRRMVSGEASPRDRGKFFAGLLLIELLTHSYNLTFSHLVGEPPELATMTVLSPIVIAAGLLGSWQMGLGMGLAVVFLQGTQGFLRHLSLAVFADLPHILQTEGWNGLLGWPWGQMLLDHYVILNPLFPSVLWAGTISGLVADLLGKHRFMPLAAMLLGIGTDLGDGCLKAVIGDPGASSFLISSGLVSGFALAAIALMVRGVQAEAARRKAEAADLARAHAELRALRAQINPHFLFNALNTIRYFVRTDPETARRLLLDLSEVFQRTLRSGEFVPLEDEISYVKAYLALEKARLGERLQVEWSIQSDAPLDHPVPTLILQPIVENAVIHGISKQSQGGTVGITIERAGDDLVLRVEDDGTGISPGRLAKVLQPKDEDATAIGLRNVDGRLQALYGEEYRLIVESEVGHGTRVKIRIPVES